jgi:hypothetical protein
MPSRQIAAAMQARLLLLKCLLTASKRYLSLIWRLRSTWLMQYASIHTPQHC